mgnify:CR=1 FL=1
MADVSDMIKETINNNDVALFIKGTAKMPTCGFSAAVVQIFNKLGVAYKDVNIYSAEGLPPALKAISNWPTFPQVFVKGELIGGCDITREMFETGELQQLLKEKNIAFAA